MSRDYQVISFAFYSKTAWEFIIIIIFAETSTL